MRPSPIALLIASTFAACAPSAPAPVPSSEEPPPAPRAATVSGQVSVFVSAASTRDPQSRSARTQAVRNALRLERPAAHSADEAPLKGATDGSARTGGTADRIVPGDLIVGSSREPDAVLITLQPGRLGLACHVVASTDGLLHLVRCVHRDGRLLSDEETRNAVDRFGRPDGIDFIETNALQSTTRLPDDTLFEQQWHYGAMALPQAWDITTSRADVVVAVIDTGIGQHADLDANVLPGIDVITDPAIAGDGDGPDDNPFDDMGDIDSRSGGSGWHGTHVAGTIAAVSNNARGVTGVAWGSRIVPVRALGKGGGTVFDAAAGIAWATGGSVSGARANANVAKIVNMSLGGEGAPTQTYQTAIDAAVARGAIIVVAAGNDDTNTSNVRPCNQDRVICVGATDLRGVATGYTNYGAEVTISAPGGATDRDDDGDGYPDGVLSTLGGGRYGRMQGTSMATPHVAGVVALMRAVRPQLTLAEAVHALTTSGTPIPNCASACGAGVLDAWKAVRQIEPSSTASPASLSLNATALVVTREVPQQTIRISNRGGTAAQVEFFGDGPWARNVYWNAPTVPLPIAPGGYADVVVSYDAEITADLDIPLSFATPGSEVAFTLRVRAPRPNPRTLIAIMYQAADGWNVAASSYAEDDGSYFVGEVPPGTYVIVGISDDDGDGHFEDDEGFGMWPSVEEPEALEAAPGTDYAAYDFAISPGSANP